MSGKAPDVHATPLTRLIAALGCVLLLAACSDDGGDEAADTTTTTLDATTTTSSTTSTTEADDQDDAGNGELVLTSTCTIEDGGWEIDVSYPESWVTNEETEFEHGTVPACRLFDPDDATPPRPNELTEFGVIVMTDPVEFDRARQPDPLAAEVLDEQDTTVGGQDAVRREERLTEDGIRGPEGARVTTYTVDLDGFILVASTTELPSLDYETNQEVLDEMMGELELARTSG